MQNAFARLLKGITAIPSYVKLAAAINIKSTPMITRQFGAMAFGNRLLDPHQFLKPETPIVEPNCGMKIKGVLKLRCKDCYFVRRQERLYVMCKTYGRHKQAAMQKKPHNSWILTHSTQHKVRPW